MEGFREEFDLDPSLIYLNSGTHSICPRAVTDEVVRNLRVYERNPTGGLVDLWRRLWEVQKGVAAFVGARPQDLFLVPNVSAALNAALLGFPLPKGSEIAHTDIEYGAMVNVCRFRAERDGLGRRAIHIPVREPGARELTPEKLADLVLSQLGPKTSMLLLSHVVTGTGLVFPIEAIARETRKRGILLIVDGAHAAGALPVDLSRLDDVDFYGSNLHKWVMGPKGTAFGWVPERNQDRLPPPQAGWTTFEMPHSYAAFGEGSRFAGRMLMSGSFDFAPFLAIPKTLEFWKRHGADRIRARIHELQKIVEEVMAPAAARWPCLSPTHPALRGPLLSYAIPQERQQGAYEWVNQELLRQGVQLAASNVQGAWVLRFSPHVYNTPEEIREGAARAVR